MKMNNNITIGKNGMAYRIMRGTLRRKTRNGFYETLADVSCLTKEQMQGLLEQLRKEIPPHTHNAREQAKKLTDSYKSKES